MRGRRYTRIRFYPKQLIDKPPLPLSKMDLGSSGLTVQNDVPVLTSFQEERIILKCVITLKYRVFFIPTFF